MQVLLGYDTPLGTTVPPLGEFADTLSPQVAPVLPVHSVSCSHIASVTPWGSTVFLVPSPPLSSELFGE
jgi:hypothetical protein